MVPRLVPERTALLVIDVQERLCAAMAKEPLARMLNRTQALLQGAAVLGLGVVLTEQYPKGLGATLPELRQLAPGASLVEKLRFSAALPKVLEALGGRDQVLIAGMEAHVCVFQTVRDLATARTVYVCRDAVISRAAEDREAGIGLCERSGALITTAEAALFDLLGEAGSPAFKAISSAVK